MCGIFSTIVLQKYCDREGMRERERNKNTRVPTFLTKNAICDSYRAQCSLALVVKRFRPRREVSKDATIIFIYFFNCLFSYFYLRCAILICLFVFFFIIPLTIFESSVVQSERLLHTLAERREGTSSWDFS